MGDELQTRGQMLRGLMREREQEKRKSLGRFLRHEFFKADPSYKGDQEYDSIDDLSRLTWESAAQAVAARVREECAQLAEDFQWQLPISGEIGLDSATDDAACAVQMQIAAAIRALNSGEQSCP